MRIMDLWNSFKEVIKPTVFRARLHGINEEHARIVQTLRLLDNPAIEDVTVATDKAAEFH